MTDTRLAFCPECSGEQSCELVRQQTTVEFRGKSYEAEEEFLRCKTCGTDIDQFGLLDPLESVYAQYRKVHGHPEPEEISALRERGGRTIEEFASLLGTNALTVRLYENGALLSEPDLARVRLLLRQSDDKNSLLTAHILWWRFDKSEDLAPDPDLTLMALGTAFHSKVNHPDLDLAA